MKAIAIYGAGGFGREVACLINLINKVSSQWDIIGFFDDGKGIGSENEYGKVLGGRNELNLWREDLAIVVAIGAPKTMHQVVTSITNPLVAFPNIIAPDLLMLDEHSLKMGKGNIIGFRCLLSCNVHIGDFNILNGSVAVGHDVRIGSYNSLMPSVNVAGSVTIGNGNFCGTSSAVLQGVHIGNDTRIGAGSVIIRNTKDRMLYVGNPAVKMDF